MNAFIRAFERIAVINLPYRQDRRVEIAAQLARVGLKLGEPPVQLFEAVRPTDAGGFASIGARGCFLSHLGVLRAARADKVQQLLILEDDCDLASGPRDALEEAVTVLNEAGSWDIAYGGYRVASGAMTSGGRWARLPSDCPVSTTHCVAFRGTAIDAVVPYLEAMLIRPPGDPAGGPMHVDGAYTWFRREHPDTVTLAAVPPIAFQRPSRTDIHDLPWYDKSTVLRPLAAVLRGLRRRPRT
jgi:hypothetical protein